MSKNHELNARTSQETIPATKSISVKTFEPKGHTRQFSIGETMFGVEVEQGEVSEEVEPGARRPHRRRG
jgi:hypothetical protein